MYVIHVIYDSENTTQYEPFHEELDKSQISAKYRLEHANKICEVKNLMRMRSEHLRKT